MADLRYVVDVDTRGAERGINNLKQTILNAGSVLAGAFAIDKLVDFGRASIDTTAKLQDLRGAFTSLTGSIEESNREFDRVRNLAKDLGADSDVLAETFVKLAGAGLEPTNRLLTALVDASKNSTDQVGALTAAADLFARTTEGGLGLEELNRLLDRGIPVFAMLKEELGLARTEISEYGKTAEGARKIQAALVRQFEKRFGGTAVRELDSISSQLSILRTVTEDAQEAFGEGLVGALGTASGGFRQLIEDNKETIRLLGQLAGETLVLLIDNLEIVAGLLAALFGAAIIRSIGFFISTLAGLLPVITAIRTGLAALAALALATPAGWIALAAAIAAAGISMFAFGDDSEEAAENVQELENNMNAAVGAVSELANQSSEVTAQTEAAGAAAGEFVLTMRDGTEAVEETETAVTKTKEEMEKLRDAVIEISDSVKEQNRDLIISLEFEGKRLQKQLDILSVTGEINDQYNIMEDAAMAVLDVEEDRANALEEIERKYQELVAAGEDEAEAARLKREEVAEVNALYDEQVSQVREIAKRNAEARAEIERQVKAAEDLKAVEADIVDYMADLKKGTAEAQREIERMNMTAFERELDDIDRQLEEKLQDQIAEINSPDNAIDPIVKQEKIQELIEATEEAKRVQKEAAREAYEYSRSFEYGWKKAYEEYADDATNAAKTAEDIFRTTTQGMEDALVGFIRTGKFEWKDFVDELVELLLRSELKRLIADIFGGITGAGGGGGGGGGSIIGGIAKAIGGLFGGGGSSSPPGATPGFGGGSGASGGGSSSGSVLGNLWSGVKKLFGFENGGSLPAGQFGIVGEAGPELITGPATITPMGKLGGTTNVTYNISAVDAASFRSLVARDPEFIHAVAMKGGSSVPMRR